jgi:hypothetical protein
MGQDDDGVGLCVINTHTEPRTFYVSLAHRCVRGDRAPLQMGWTRDAQGQETECITFILVVGASTLMTVCYLQDPQVYTHHHTHRARVADAAHQPKRRELGQHTSATFPRGSWLSGGAHTPQLEVPLRGPLTSCRCTLTAPLFFFCRWT